MNLKMVGMSVSCNNSVVNDEALALFERFSHPETGYGAIVQAVADDLREGLSLDYKVLRKNGALVEDGNFPASLRKHLAIYTSGFANVSGGVLVWGVNCPNNNPMSCDPVPNPSKLCEHMKGISHNIVDPPCVLEHRYVAGNDGRGFVVTYIPQAIKRPIMAIFEAENRYYMRTMDSCVAMPHTFVAALMSARTTPAMDINFQEPEVHFSGPSTRTGPVTSFVPEFRIVTHLKLFNHGPGLAKDCAVIVHGLAGNALLRPASGCLARELESALGSAVEGSWVITFPDGFTLHPGTGFSVGQVDFATKDLAESRTIGVELSAEGFSKTTELTIPFNSKLGLETALNKAHEAKFGQRSKPHGYI